MAEPRETDADVDRTALLGREPAERASGVDEGDETERDSQSRLQQTNLPYEESCQRNENARENVPSAQRLPLEGEWIVCASGETNDSKGNANASNAAVEHADGSSRSKEAGDTMENKSEGCEGGASERTSIDELEAVVECCQQLCMADGNPGRGVQPADVPNESDPLVTRSVEPYVENGKTSVRVHFRGASWCTDDTNGAGHGVDGLTGETDVSRGSTDMLGASNRAETAGISYGEGAGTYLGVRDAKRVVNATDGVRSRTDASTGPTDVPSVDTDAVTTANATETVKTSRNEQKLLNSPSGTAKRTPDVPNGSGSHADASSVHMDTHCVGNATETATNEAEHVRMRQTDEETQGSPNAIEIATPKRARRWKRVSIGDGDVYAPWNTPVAAIETANRIFTFGEVESGDERVATSVESERAGDGDGDGYGDDGDDGNEDGTASSGDVDSKRVEAAQLAIDSQLEHQSRRIQGENLPASSWPLIQFETRPYGLARRRPRRGRLKIERINGDQVSKAQKVEMTHLAHAYAAQPPENDPNQAYGVVRPRRRRGRIKIAPINVSRALEVEKTYLGRANAMRSIRRPKKRISRVNKLTFDCRMQGERRRDDGDYG